MHVGRHLQRAPEETAEDHLRSWVDPMQDLPRGPHQLREALRVGAAEGDDVRLVPDLPLADRLRCQFGIVRPEFPVGAVAERCPAQERFPGQQLVGGQPVRSPAVRTARAVSPRRRGRRGARGSPRVRPRGRTRTSPGSFTFGLNGSICDQASGSRTLLTSASAISSKSESDGTDCGEMLTKPAGARAAACAGAASSASESAIVASLAVKFMYPG